MTAPKLERKKIFLVVLLLVLLLFPLLQLAHGGLNYWLHMMLYTFMFIAMTSSWNIMGGYAGYISLGHTVFFATGGYLATVASRVLAGILTFW